MTPIAPLIEAFLDETLARQRGVSRHTRDSYALSFQLLFMFAAKRLKVSPSALTLEQLDAGLISAFLEYLEDKRKNAPVTRNVRLAAIKSFFRFLEYRQPAALEHVRRVLAIPFKKTDQRLVPYLLREELQAVLDAPDPATRDGVRDRAMLHLAVCAGLRVSELTGLKLEDIDLSSMSIRVLGKGRRERTLPLWKTTAAALRAWLAGCRVACRMINAHVCLSRGARCAAQQMRWNDQFHGVELLCRSPRVAIRQWSSESRAPTTATPYAFQPSDKLIALLKRPS